MKRMRNLFVRLLFCSVCVLLTPQLVWSQDDACAQFELQFEQNGASIGTMQVASGEVLRALADTLRVLQADDMVRIMDVKVTSYASPEGGVDYNNALVGRRSDCMTRYVEHDLEVPTELVQVQNVGIGWDALIKMVEESDMPYRAEVLDVLINEPIETWARVNPTDRWLTLVDSRVRQLMRLRGGRPYWYLFDHFFPALRSTHVVLITYKRLSALPVDLSGITRMAPEPLVKASVLLADEISLSPSALAAAATPVAPVAAPTAPVTTTPPIVATTPVTATTPVLAEVDTVVAPLAQGGDSAVVVALPAEGEAKKHREYKPFIAFKTNLLFDAATMLNVEVEVPIGRRWSVAGEWVFPWWASGDGAESKRHCLQLLHGTVEGKYWFGERMDRPRLTGWFASLYAGGGLYDLEYAKTGYQGEFFIAAGLGAGYAHTINKKGNLRMEYSLGVGYLRTNYRKYNEHWGINDEWHAIREYNGIYTWIGPTRARVSLVWML